MRLGRSDETSLLLNLAPSVSRPVRTPSRRGRCRAGCAGGPPASRPAPCGASRGSAGSGGGRSRSSSVKLHHPNASIQIEETKFNLIRINRRRLPTEACKEALQWGAAEQNIPLAGIAITHRRASKHGSSQAGRPCSAVVTQTDTDSEWRS